MNLHISIQASLEQEFQNSLSDLQQSRADLQNLRTAYHELELHEYPPQLQRRHNFLQRNLTTAMNQHLKLIAALTRHQPDTIAKPAAAEPEPLPAPPPPKEPVVRRYGMDENILITVVDGQTISQPTVGPRRWLELMPMANVSHYTCHYYFPEAVIPPEYAFCLQHDGYRFAHTRSVYISYSPEEFQRLCQLQIDTSSPHHPDGQRLKYWRLWDTLSLPDDEEQSDSEIQQEQTNEDQS